MATASKKMVALARKDDAADKKAGIKEGSKKDMALDAKKGIPSFMRNGGKVGAKKKGK